jgi:hypothetical protein
MMGKTRLVVLTCLVLGAGLVSGCAGDPDDCGNGRGEVGAVATVRSLLVASVDGDVDRACDMIGGTNRPGRPGLVEPLDDLAQVIGDTAIGDVDIAEGFQGGTHVIVIVTVPGHDPMEFAVVLDHNGRGQVLEWPGFP